eukprot:TRINITY_DN1877_c0_g1_i1.p1 TRINITY_DN1877_c0_g1~~TRINITY_DN1877_c0_g1_i1.p1  ORF type:complete len:185 (+),score=28.80 TRINITY_DN1877_c0_g1_i1:49-603(+)
MTALKLVFPGTELAALGPQRAGDGTFVRDGRIYASLLGIAMAEEDEIHVVQTKDAASVPTIGSIVTGKVTKISPREVQVSIMCVDKTPLPNPFRGLLRLDDIRSHDKLSIEIAKCFRPTDIVVAEVLSLGDARSYYLTTAKEHLGVIYATSIAGHPLQPLNWQEMSCAVTGMREFRKVAKPADA